MFISETICLNASINVHAYRYLSVSTSKGIVIHESSCEREINVNERIHARLINSVSSVPRGMNKLPGFETKLINTSSGISRGENI